MSDIGVGKIIDVPRGRDAIHVAVIPVVAFMGLEPGYKIGIRADGKAGLVDEPIGIVDPFLSERVRKGQTFYMFMFPGSITSLRHDWTHPKLDSLKPAEAVNPRDPEGVHRKYLEYEASRAGLSFDEFMEYAKDYAEHGEYANQGGRWEGHHLDDSDEFWLHYELYTGTAPSERYGRHSFFSCSC